VSSATAIFTYCDIQGGYTGTGNIDSDPLFCSEPLHDYYLSQTVCGQSFDSPCVDTGSDTAANLGLDALTTRTDCMPDEGVVDMGYHAPYMLLILSITRSGNDIIISWNALTGVSYTVQWSTDMETWNDVPVGETDTWTDTGVTETAKYYRVFEQ